MQYDSDYVRLQKAFSKVQRENHRLRKLLAMDNLSALDFLIRDCLKYNRDQLRKIALEFQLTDYDCRNLDSLNELIETLQLFCNELNSMIETGGYK